MAISTSEVLLSSAAYHCGVNLPLRASRLDNFELELLKLRIYRAGTESSVSRLKDQMSSRSNRKTEVTLCILDAWSQLCNTPEPSKCADAAVCIHLVLQAHPRKKIFACDLQQKIVSNSSQGAIMTYSSWTSVSQLVADTV